VVIELNYPAAEKQALDRPQAAAGATTAA